MYRFDRDFLINWLWALNYEWIISNTNTKLQSVLHIYINIYIFKPITYVKDPGVVVRVLYVLLNVIVTSLTRLNNSRIMHFFFHEYILWSLLMCTYKVQPIRFERMTIYGEIAYFYPVTFVSPSLLKSKYTHRAILVLSET